jgi:hypothetical protein
MFIGVMVYLLVEKFIEEKSQREEFIRNKNL